MMKKNLLDLDGMDSVGLNVTLDLAEKVKKAPKEYNEKLEGKTVALVFEQPALATRLAYEAAIAQLGGNAVYIEAPSESMAQLGKILDTADLIIGRLPHEQLQELAKATEAPVINARSELGEPCQALAEILTVKQKRGPLRGVKLAYVGDGHNGLAYSLLFGCSLAGMSVAIATPFANAPRQAMVQLAESVARMNHGTILVTENVADALKGVDAVVTDNWKAPTVYQLTVKSFQLPKQDAIFLHPRLEHGNEISTDVTGNKQFYGLQEKENLLPVIKATLLLQLKMV